ncbi:MAG: hypothetical protein HY514_02590 [Candidatus Aenigmarchaeota archaeon]|nr:hypothetical protein [Candidatus Aenigmarchaeota archaeon]
MEFVKMASNENGTAVFHGIHILNIYFGTLDVYNARGELEVCKAWYAGVNPAFAAKKNLVGRALEQNRRHDELL